ncbi:hypothetical protein CSOJ01_07930 [Colletotrichum sojae]|uniref:Uncharacterized protein n=1 Tax=Colletotrichum sojae TaxID=2175907 RepID=A0A8H6J7N7_9PEZI|nr:hypothetical protein CSOJ01_07930 [Colletotrichum sojae]
MPEGGRKDRPTGRHQSERSGIGYCGRERGIFPAERATDHGGSRLLPPTTREAKQSSIRRGQQPGGRVRRCRSKLGSPLSLPHPSSRAVQQQFPCDGRLRSQWWSPEARMRGARLLPAALLHAKGEHPACTTQTQTDRQNILGCCCRHWSRFPLPH